MKKYLVVDRSDSCYLSVGEYETYAEVIESTQHVLDTDKVTIYEVSRKLKLSRKVEHVLDDKP